MKLRSALLALASLPLLACSPIAPSARSFALAGTVQLSEVLFNPPSTNDNNQFIELKCTPNAALDAYGLLIIEGDVSTTAEVRGRVDLAKALTGVTCGASGFVVLQQSTVYGGVTGTTYVDFLSTTLEIGTQTILLVQMASYPSLGTDLDVGDNGVLDDATLASKIVDSVAINDGDAMDLTYASPVITDDGYFVQAISRFEGTIGTAAENWYAGQVVSSSTDMSLGMVAPPFFYDAANNLVSANFPASGTLSPGQANTVSDVLDLAGGPSIDQATSTPPDLSSGTPTDEDLAGQPSSPDLKKPRDLAGDPTIEEDLAGSEEPPPDMRRRSGASSQRACSAGGSFAATTFNLLVVAAALLSLRRRHPFAR